MKNFSNYNFFEVRNGIELITAICFAKRLLLKNSTQSVIYCTNFITKDKLKKINNLDQIYFHNGFFASNSRFFNFLNIFLFVVFLKRIKFVSIYLFHEVSPIIFIKKYHKIISIIEHGESNYVVDAESYNYRFSIYRLFKLKFLGNKYIGESSFISKVYLSDISRCPKSLIQKAEGYSLRDMAKYLTANDLMVINSFYDFSLEFVNCSVSILLTQPFSELSLMTEVEKIKFYKDFIFNYDGEIVIKPHPLEHTDYSTLFPYIKIIDKKIPIEIFALNNFKFNKVISVNSSASNKLIAKEKIYLRCDSLNGRL